MVSLGPWRWVLSVVVGSVGGGGLGWYSLHFVPFRARRSVLCIVDFMTIKLFDLKFYFDGFNALYLQHNTHLGQCP